MPRRIPTFAAIVAVSTGAIAAERAPEQLAQSGQWEINYDTDSCHLFRPFGSGDQKVYIKFTRYEPSDGFELTLYGKRFAISDAYSTVVSDFASDGTTFESHGLNGRSGELRSVIVGRRYLVEWSAEPDATAPRITPEQEQAVRDVTLRIKGRKPITLLLGAMGPPMRAMRTCTTALVKEWGFDPSEQASLSRPVTPKGDPSRWLGTSDYPTSAASRGAIGLVHFRLDVEGDGSVSGCHVQSESRPADFSQVTCRAITRRAKFDPALDKDGKPIRSYYVQTVRWVLGDY